MYLSNLLVTGLAATTTVRAFDITEGAYTMALSTKRSVANILNLVNTMFNKQSEACPAVWTEISTQLTAQFLADGQCTGKQPIHA